MRWLRTVRVQLVRWARTRAAPAVAAAASDVNMWRRSALLLHMVQPLLLLGGSCTCNLLLLLVNLSNDAAGQQLQLQLLGRSAGLQSCCCWCMCCCYAAAYADLWWWVQAITRYIQRLHGLKCADPAGGITEAGRH